MNTQHTIVRTGMSLVFAAVASGVIAGPAFAADEAGSPLDDVTQDVAAEVESGIYGGNPEQEAALVAQEERRLIDVDLVANGILFPQFDASRPFRVATEPVSTLVLPARDSAYTEADLEQIAPQSFYSITPGEYVLSEHLVLMEGATLDLRRAGGLTLHLASQEDGFASIVVDGGSLVVEGTPGEPVSIDAWDSVRAIPDTSTGDGRAYIRVKGGYASMSEVKLSNLGFWSGVTGGLSLTGTELASTLGLTGEAEIPEVYLAAPEEAQTVEAGKPLVVDGSSEGETGVDLTRGSTLYGNGVTAWLSGLTVTGNAFGLFVSDANSIELQNSEFTGNLVDGVVFHREVTNSRVTSVKSVSNGGDGFRVSRGSQSVLLDSVTASGNAGSGIVIDGSPLALGPSATGQTVAVYGGHSVVNSTISENGKNGIVLRGGDDLLVRRNTISGSTFGIVVSEGATNVTIDENRISGADKQGIALKEGVQGAVTGNAVEGGHSGIHIRDSSVVVERNTVEDVHGHGVTFVGDVAGSVAGLNLITGEGNSPIDSVRASGASIKDNNDISGWTYVNLVDRIIRIISKPMTFMWTLLALLLLITAFRGSSSRDGGFSSPYRDRTPLHQLTRGAVDPSTVPGVVTVAPPQAPSAPVYGGTPEHVAVPAAAHHHSGLPRRRPEHETVSV